MSTRSTSTLGFLAAAAVPLAGHGQVAYEPLAVTGAQVPGMPAGTTYLRFASDPVANDTGGAAFRAVVRDAGGQTSGTAVFANTGAGPTRLVGHEDDPAPGAPAGTTYGAFESFPLFLGNDGRVTFGARPVPNYFWIYSAGAGGEAPQVVRVGDHPPGTGAGREYLRFGTPVASRAGNVAYFAYTNVPGSAELSYGVWAGPTSSPQAIMQQGEAAPGTPAGVVYGTQFQPEPAIGNDGTVAYRAVLSGPGVTPGNNLGLFAGGPGAARLLARNGEQADGLPAGVNYAGFADLAVADNGRVVFRASLGGTATDDTNRGIYTAGPAAGARPQVVARTGDAVPGWAGVNYSSLSWADVDNAGRTAFFAGFAGAGMTSQNDSGWVVAAPGGAATVIAREGDNAPGMWDAAQFASPHVPVFDMNSAGQVVYETDLTGWATHTGNNKAVFLYDPAWGSVLVVRTGDRIDVGGGDFRTVAPGGIGLLTGDASGFGDDGRVAMLLTFTDGTSGIFVATVPEPAAVGAIGLGALRLRRRRNAGPIRAGSARCP